MTDQWRKNCNATTGTGAESDVPRCPQLDVTDRPANEPPIREPETPPEGPFPPQRPPVEEPPSPRKPPVKEPPPEDPNRNPPHPPQKRTVSVVNAANAAG